MLEKPDLTDEKINACLQRAYGLSIATVEFLPIGADLNTAVYRVLSEGGIPYFLKLRRGSFDETSVALPKFLSNQGIAHLITPLTTSTGKLWTTLDAFTVILYPFVEGRDGYETELSERQWSEFGTALKRIHTERVPPALLRRIRRENYSPDAREMVKKFASQPDDARARDAVALELTAFLRLKRDEILDLVTRADRLASMLQTAPPEFVVCHSDLHAGNLLIQENGAFYIVDWDDPILAPKERDLMFPGGAQGFIGHSAQQEETFFYQGYGAAAIDPRALAYYRFERILQDVAIYCEQLLMTDAGGEDREQALKYMKSNFLPNGTIEAAHRAGKLC